jgi:hypothetical protein
MTFRIRVTMASAKDFDRWRARDPQRVAAFGSADEAMAIPRRQDPNFLRFADVLRIFEAFLLGEPRPAKYEWRNINHLVS